MTNVRHMASEVAVSCSLTVLIRPQGALTVHQVDLRAQEEDLVGQALGRGQHLSVVGADEILHELLQLVPVHLGESLGDGKPQLHLMGVPDSVQ